MSKFMSYDPWGNITTRNGISGDLVVSALQKSIRRGLTEAAVTFAYEMYITSEQFEDKLWRRLQAISVEDVGFGDLSAPVLINTLNQMRQNFPYTDGDRPIFFVHAIRYLAAAKKDRTSDNLKEHCKNRICLWPHTRDSRFCPRHAYTKRAQHGSRLPTFLGRGQSRGK